MVAPLLIAGGLASGLSALYYTGKAYDNIRYWNDYKRRYGVRPKYPFRVGRYDYLGYTSKVVGIPYIYRNFNRTQLPRSYRYRRYYR